MFLAGVLILTEGWTSEGLFEELVVLGVGEHLVGVVVVAVGLLVGFEVGGEGLGVGEVGRQVVGRRLHEAVLVVLVHLLVDYVFRRLARLVPAHRTHF
jgi:hypothetical protein